MKDVVELLVMFEEEKAEKNFLRTYHHYVMEYMEIL